MKKTLLFLTISIFTITSFAQKAKKPTIMVVPSDVWCNQNNFTQTFNNQGSCFESHSILLMIDKVIYKTTINGIAAKLNRKNNISAAINMTSLIVLS